MANYTLMCTGSVAVPTDLHVPFTADDDESARKRCVDWIPNVCNRHIFRFYLWRENVEMVGSWQTIDTPQVVDITTREKRHGQRAPTNSNGR